jgi:hypothetical protein
MTRREQVLRTLAHVEVAPPPYAVYFGEGIDDAKHLEMLRDEV